MGYDGLLQITEVFIDVCKSKREILLPQVGANPRRDLCTVEVQIAPFQIAARVFKCSVSVDDLALRAEVMNFDCHTETGDKGRFNIVEIFRAYIAGSKGLLGGGQKQPGLRVLSTAQAQIRGDSPLSLTLSSASIHRAILCSTRESSASLLRTRTRPIVSHARERSP